MTVNSAALRDTLRLWSSGVSIVSTLTADNNADGRKYVGMTVSTFNSLSLDPALILVCLAKNTTTTDHVLASGMFSVSILSGDQADLSDRFAGRLNLPSNQDRFDGVPLLTAVTGAPILQNALAWLDCRVHAVHDGSTHWIVVGEVVATGHKDEIASPLIHFDRAYHALAPEQERP